MGHTSVTCSECGRETDSSPCQHCGADIEGEKSNSPHPDSQGIYKVYYDKSYEKWVISVGTSRYDEELDAFDNKDPAVDEAREMAKDNKPSFLTIEKKNGEIQDEHEYPV